VSSSLSSAVNAGYLGPVDLASAVAKPVAARKTYPMDENHRAVESSSSRHPQDWGRAMSVVLTRLAEKMALEGGETLDEVLVGRDIRLNIVAEGEDGARITATCPAARVSGDDGDPAPQS
jgi:hypothetical protein